MNGTSPELHVLSMYKGQTARRFILSDDAMVTEMMGGPHDGRLVCTYSQCVKDRDTSSCRHIAAVAKHLALLGKGPEIR